MKLDPEQRRELGKKLTELLETEQWVIAFTDMDKGKMGVHAMAGKTKPKTVSLLLHCLDTSTQTLIDQAKDNYP